MSEPITYASAGVDVEAGDKAVELMKASVRRATRPEVLGGLGGFAGLFDATAIARMSHPVLATSTDGVGTKVAIAQALEDLVAEKPYLSAQGGKRFQGTADGGARNDASKPSQLSESDLDRMSPEQVEAARKEGRLNNLLGIKT